MRDYWNLAHAAGHLALLGTMGGHREHYQALTEGIPVARSAFAFALTNTGNMTFILRGAWGAGRLGKDILPACKKALGEDAALFDLLDTIFALVAIARRTSGLRAEIAKALRATPHTATTPNAQRLRDGLGDVVQTMCDAAVGVLDISLEDAERFRLACGEDMLAEANDAIPEAWRGELARTMPLVTLADGITDGRMVFTSLMLIAATARGQPEQFYLPREIVRALHSPWEPGCTEALLRPMKKVDRAQRVQAVRRSTPGPNEACSCGSGRKYKKCCGRMDGGQGSPETNR